MTPGIVLCSRVHSRRLPRKALIEFNGKPALWHLCNRLLKSGYPVCLAIPMEHEDDTLIDAVRGLPVKLFRGHKDNVLARMFWAAFENDYDPIIRVTHDDLFVDVDMMREMVDDHINNKTDYTFVSKCLRGTDCEVVSRKLIEASLSKYGGRPFEHLSYAFRDREFNATIFEYIPDENKQLIERLSLDWPEDEQAIRLIFEILGSQPIVDSDSLYKLLRRCPSILGINKLPFVTVYTCAYNAEQTIERAMQSVMNQTYRNFEYIVMDDGSNDNTARKILSIPDESIKAIRLSFNMGLASACNMALRNARGAYYLRLDADDELMPDALQTLMDIALKQRPEVSAIYPAYYRGDAVYQNDEYHMGGALIKASAYEDIKFCDGLRHMEGVEFFNRLSQRYLVIKHIQPTWKYHVNENGLSNSKDHKREQTKTFLSGLMSHWPSVHY